MSAVSPTLTAGLREMIAAGRLTEDMIPDDYQWLLLALNEPRYPPDGQKNIWPTREPARRD